MRPVEHDGSSTQRREAAIAHVASQQYGVFSHAQAIAAGFTRHAIAYRVAPGTWTRVLPGVFRFAGAPVERPGSRARCVSLGGRGRRRLARGGRRAGAERLTETEISPDYCGTPEADTAERRRFVHGDLAGVAWCDPSTGLHLSVVGPSQAVDSAAITLEVSA